jgi:hypothetical protein
MLLNNKTILLPNISALYALLNHGEDESLYFCSSIYEERIAISSVFCSEKRNNIIKIWKTNSLFDYWFESYSSQNFIACIDYTIHDTYIKINHIGVNDYHRIVDELDIDDLITNIVEFIKQVAKKENKERILLDVHENLRIFLKYYYYLGFKTTERKCKMNPFWIETELIV